MSSSSARTAGVVRRSVARGFVCERRKVIPGPRPSPPLCLSIASGFPPAGGKGISMKVDPFVLERWQSEWENRAPFNLAESGVLPLSLGEVMEPAELAALAGLRQGYGHTNG